MLGFDSSSGIGMLLKSMGFDPEVIEQKAKEVEVFGRLFVGHVSEKIRQIDERLARIETAVGARADAQTRIESVQAGTDPAGPNSPAFNEALASHLPQGESIKHG